MMSFVSTVKRFLYTRDELAVTNIRRELWPLWLIFPLTVILGDFRYFNLYIEFAGLQSYELMLYPLGLGWLVLVFIPKRLMVPLLNIAAVCCAVILPFQLLLTNDTSLNLPGALLAVFMAFQFFNGICAGCAFSIFCFRLNNVERLFGMALIIFYYSLYYTVYRYFPSVQAVYKVWGGITVMAFYLVIIFMLNRKSGKQAYEDNEVTESADGKSSNIKIVIALHIIYYTIMCMINYIESADNIIYSLPYGLGQLISILVIVLIMLISNRNSLYIWLMFLVFSLFGLSIVNYNSEAAYFAGSLIYGLGDGLGYIIIYYLCSGAIKKSKSIKMFRLFCLVLFIEYFFISGILSQAFDRYEGSNHVIALGVVLFLCSCCFLVLPYLQKKLFAEDWTDGLHLKNMPEFTKELAETEKVNVKEHLDLTEREHEVFTMLLKGMTLKDIAFTLKIKFSTINFHSNNLYRKLGISGRAELSAKYGSAAQD
ncbi:MAG: helix-turn-helix transcriptional regulator [Treponema sp.]|nr:helix-turn-helix transcriptional regulator [Treponema sp.]